MSRHNAAWIGLIGATALGVLARALTITPNTYDFGTVAVGGAQKPAPFRVSGLGTNPRDTAVAVIAGPDAADFVLDPGSCKPPFWGTDSCEYQVWFTPRLQGGKAARLEVTDARGVKATASLKGTGVTPVCTNRVVFCNYAHLYSGTFNWTSNLNGPKSSYSETVSVAILHGVATCNGSATSTFEGRSRKGAINGSGLLAVEFDRDTVEDPVNASKSTSRLVYRITVACPSPDWPASADEPATPSRPAELGDLQQQTYNQPASEVGINLDGSTSYPAPESDALNGVTGAVQVNWSLKRS